MKNSLIAFFEIPATNFERAVEFYENVFKAGLSRLDCEAEKMAFFPIENGRCPGAISYAPDFEPSERGVLISLRVENMEKTIRRIIESGGTIVKGKTKIDSANMGWFAIFTDSEGNRIGLYSDN